MSDRWIRASEISEYVYCRRAWWLQRMAGHASENVHELERGVAYHQQHGRFAQQSAWGQKLAYALIFVTVSVLVFSLLMTVGM